MQRYPSGKLMLIESGAGIMLRLCDGWDVQSCRAYFKNCALRAFEPRALQRQLTRISWLRRLWLACSLILTDSKYPSRNLDTLLEEQYGTTRSIMDYSKADAMGIKYGITLTTVGNSDTLVATNYNGIGQNRESTGKTSLNCAFNTSNGTRLYNSQTYEGATKNSALGDVSYDKHWYSIRD